jgi:hypothetical protein
VSTLAQGDLFTGRFVGRNRRQSKAPVVLLPLAERIANEERALRDLTEACGHIVGGDRQARAYQKAAANLAAHIELLRAELAQEAA